MVVRYIYTSNRNDKTPLEYVLTTIVSPDQTHSAFPKIVYVNNTVPDNILHVTRQLNVNKRILNKIEYEKVNSLSDLSSLIEKCNRENQDTHNEIKFVVIIDEFHWLIDSQVNTFPYNEINRQLVEVIQAGYTADDTNELMVYILDDRENEFIKLLVDEFNEI